MYKWLCLLVSLCSTTSFAASTEIKDSGFEYQKYIGIMGGYGGTTWQGLVPAVENQNVALNISTPIDVHEGGFVWGALAGYELSPFFALEANYMRYPNAHIIFDQDSLFAFENDGDVDLFTKTQTYSLFGKVMLVLPRTHIRFFSSVGVAGVQRSDAMNNDWRISPTFGLGLNDNITPHILFEVMGNYTAGYGESELNPAQDFIPFLYSVVAKLAYRF